MTKAEWAMLALWCQNNRTLPRGNCDFGKDIEERGYQASVISQDGRNGGCVLTGSGPLGWSHNRGGKRHMGFKRKSG